VTQAGTVIADRYLLRERIGGASTSEVWHAFDTRLNRPVVVKLLARDIEAPMRSNPLVTVYDRGERDGRAYLVMEHPSAGSLRERLDTEGRLAEGPAMTLVTQVGYALHAAHTAGIVHRDLRPGHILMRSDGTVAVIDAGLAPAWWSPVEPHATRWRARAPYLAPEQVLGAPVTAAADVYALGVVAYECLTGRVPLAAGSPVETAQLHAYADPPPLPASVSAAAREVVARALAKDPAARWPSAAAMAAAAEATAARAAGAQAPADPIADRVLLRALTVQLPMMPDATGSHTPTKAGPDWGALDPSPSGPPPAPSVGARPTYRAADTTVVLDGGARTARVLYALAAAAVAVLIAAIAFLVPEFRGVSDRTGPGGSKVSHALGDAAVDVGVTPTVPGSPADPPTPAPQMFNFPVNQMSPEFQDGTCVYRVMYGNNGSTGYAKARYYAGACGGTTIQVAALRTGLVLTWEAAKGQEFSVVTDNCGTAHDEQATSESTPAYGVGVRITFGETGHVVVFLDGSGPTPPVVRTC
jgi:serine/threonine-protein kinase